MIVLEVYAAGITIRKGKCQPPVLIDLQSPGSGAISLEFVQIEVRQGNVV